MLGHGTTIRAWERRNESVDIKRAINHSPLLRGPSTFSKEANERFSYLTQIQANLPVHNVKVEHQLSQLPDKSDHVTEYSREDSGVLKFYEVIMVEPMFRPCQFVWMSKLYVSVLLLYSGLYRSYSLSDVHLTTLAR